METKILTVLVGSRAHGTSTEKSDYDYRGVFVVPTQSILTLGGQKKSTNWQEGKVDDTSWEIGHFLHLATKSNPTILEVFGAPLFDPPKDNHLAEELRALFPHVWSTRSVWNAFSGYARNKWRKVETDKYDVNTSNSMDKNALATARVLYQGRHLMDTGKMRVKLPEEFRDEQILMREEMEKGRVTLGEILDYIEELKKQFWNACDARGWDKTSNLEPVNEFLLKVRKEFWT